MFQTAKIVEGYRNHIEDRAEIIECGLNLVIVVADGAGGVSGGARASELAVQIVRDAVQHNPAVADTLAWCSLLREIDLILEKDPAAGETTVVVAALGADGIVGASVGDSCAWWIDTTSMKDLTAQQKRKPVLGTGVAMPVPFQADFHSGTLLLATDGLIKYASRERICETARGNDITQGTTQLLDLVRLQSRALPDDVAVVLCRRVE